MYINLHAGTPKPQPFLFKSPGLQCSNMVLLYGLREVKVKFNKYGVLNSICEVICY